ncbi:hypothetical protein BDV96DRAFT_643627 [Lophiotrema nucula]|uniref:Uncharacterized protein n=1 Tax=Lophiotrema nucula TaxID=690887 RepID=A0A6A5ZGM3_9PLEO|nr:hypothetical protein BDV96DRAFT_643627 [Lophiotrema nucula]
MTASAGERMSSPSQAPAMEPLAQRLRLHRSVEVDESNPDYIRKKREGEIALKNSFDAIIAKYEKMPESASDVIDMSTGRVAVDNGHLRSIQKQDPTMQAAQFLGSFLEDNRGINLDDEDDWDELAPAELSKPKRDEKNGSKLVDEDTRGPRDAAIIEEGGQPGVSPAQGPAELVPQTPSAALASIQPSPMPFTVPLPQNPQSLLTPEGQNAFILNLNLAMNQFVTNTMVSVTNIFGNAAGLPMVSAPTPQAVVTPSNPPATEDSIRPGADPKWWFPPLPPRAPRSSLAYSSPIPAGNSERKRRKSFDKPSRSSPSKRRAIQVVSVEIPAEQVDARASDVQCVVEREENVEISLPAVRVAGESRQQKDRNAKYKLSPEEDLYLIEQREIHETPWSTIRQSREKWKSWPVHALMNRYTKRLKIRSQNTAALPDLEADDVPVNQTPEIGPQQPETAAPEDVWQVPRSPQVRPTPRATKVFSSQVPSPRERYEQLLTPTSLESPKVAHESPVTDDEPVVTLDADDDFGALELASASPEIPETQEPEAPDFASSSVPPEDAILPSVESDVHVSVDDVGEDEQTDAVEACTEPSQLQSFAKPAPKRRGPGRPAKPKTKHQLPKLDDPAITSTEDDIDTSTPAQPKQREQQRLRRSSVSRSLILRPTPTPIDDTPDELEQSLQPPTPEIKQEETTPPPFFTALLSTPKSAPQLPLQNSSTARATPRSDRQKRLYNNSVKAMWAKRGKTPARKMQSLKKAKSMQDVRSRLVDDWSEDDLA